MTGASRALLSGILASLSLGCHSSDSPGDRPSVACQEPAPITAQSQDTGYEVCGGSNPSQSVQFTHRKAAVACPTRGACATDKDCPGGQICSCTVLSSLCLPSDCTTDGDCESGYFCASYTGISGCGYAHGYACQKPQDECFTGSDCPPGLSYCGQADGHRVCQKETCITGRPLVVDGGLRQAPLRRRGGWASDGALS